MARNATTVPSTETPTVDPVAVNHHVRHLTQAELAQRWKVSEACLERYRSQELGPLFLKIGGRVRYRQEDVEAFERDSLRSGTAKSV